MNKSSAVLASNDVVGTAYPRPAYIPLADINFVGRAVVTPAMLPPNAMVFPRPWFNKMLNIPSTQAIYGTPRNGRVV